MKAPSTPSFPKSRLSRLVCGGFSLVEVLIAVTLMSVIVLGLLAMFSQTQRAFRTGVTQTDVMEAGRSALEMVAREVEQTTPTCMSNSVNLFAGWNNYSLVQSLTGKTPAGNDQWRTNIQQNLLFTSRENQTWSWIGYGVVSTGALPGALYRYETNVSAIEMAEVVARGRVDPFTNTNRQAQLVDGVVGFRVLAYDLYGQLITPFVVPTNVWDRVLVSNSVPGELSYNYWFLSNAVPAYVEIELGLLEAKTLERARNLPYLTGQPAAAQPRVQFLEKQVGHVQVFRQRIPIRNVDPSVYQ